MVSSLFSVLFIVFFAASLLVRFWLASRQIRHVLRHRATVPPQFAEKITLRAHQKAADYTIARTKFGLVELFAGAFVLIGFTLLGGLQALSIFLLQHLGTGRLEQISLMVAVTLITGLIDLPFDYYRQFSLEGRFGFNKMKPALFFIDLAKSTLVSAVIGLPLLWVVLSLMEQAGSLWWFYTWLVFSAFSIVMQVLYPTLIAPLFNKFVPLDDASLKERITKLMDRVGFTSRGLFVMDGSKRSGHGNAYFSGFGAAKRVVFFDTLLTRLQPQEVEAILAHELGHFKLKHITKRTVLMFAVSLVFLALLGYLKNQVWFYVGLGVVPLPDSSNDAVALILFMLALPVFTFFLSPVMSIGSRKHEYEADAFAARQAQAQDLVSALVKLYEDNASTLTPDPLHSAFYDSHPNAAMRIARLVAQ
ncbi:MAG TPA: M48 family metallopeptidase [Burkholderiaceae bacterium]